MTKGLASCSASTDDEEDQLDTARGWHFPRAANGSYAGFHPADGGAAIAHLETQRGEYFIVRTDRIVPARTPALGEVEVKVTEAEGNVIRKLDGKPAHRDQAVVELLREVFTETAAVRFEGNGYSEEWKVEAKKRGLPNLSDTPAAIVAAMKPEHHTFLVETGVLSQLEVDARFNVAVERYIKQVTLEAETLLDVVNTAVIPAVERQLASTGAAWRVLYEAGVKRFVFTADHGYLLPGFDTLALTERTPAIRASEASASAAR